LANFHQSLAQVEFNFPAFYRPLRGADAPDFLHLFVC
jgi:hypothetical protein